MKKLIILGFLSICYAQKTTSQTRISIKGKVIDALSEKPLTGVSVNINENSFFSETQINGTFKIENIPIGKSVVVQLSFFGYNTQRIPLKLSENKNVDLGIIFLDKVSIDVKDMGIISLNDGDLLDDGTNTSDYVSGLFQSSKDVFLRAAAFNFSQAWFKVRGYDSSYGTISINGIEMNKLFDGRPQWSNWGGLNDALRNQEFSNGIGPSENTFGGILGSTNFITRASQYRAGKKISISSTNNSYAGRIMATYATGLNKKDWAFVVSSSRRFAQEGYLEGTTYNAWSAFMSVEKKFNKNHSLNLTAITASNRRGKSSPNTQEVFNLRGNKYNAYWGAQNGEKRNSRIKEIFEPIVLISHFFNTKKTSLKTSIAYQFGHIGNSRLGYFNAPNPDPTYWKYLPSSFLRFQDNLDYSTAYLTEQEFINNGQLNWKEMYQENAEKEHSLYYLYEDRVDDSQLTFNSNLTTSLSNNLLLNAGISIKNLTSQNYANMLDLLGGNNFIDLDQYAFGNAQHNDLNYPDKTVGVGDKFQYNYKINASVANAFTQFQVTGKKTDYFIGLNFKSTNFQRNGLFKNGTYLNNSYGKGDKQSFSNINLKGGFTYKLTGRHLINIKTAYISNAPTIRTSFSNSRVNNMSPRNLTSEKILTGDVSYIFRSPKIQTRITSYYTQINDAIETSFFFAQGLRGNQADFVNEIITGVAKKHLGAELSAAYQVTSNIQLLGAGSFGQFTYNNNPKLTIQSESFADDNSDFGTAYLKNYHLSGTPQRAYSLGFEYRDPNYWWFQTNGNLLSHNYLDISPLLRTNNFFLDADGIPFVDDETGVEVSQEQVNSLLKQEKFNDAFVVNLVGGKSWLSNDKYLGFFVAINNLLGEVFKTGGFEQSRKANYIELKQDKQLEKPVFGPKYWYGNKTSYYLNLYMRF